MTLNHFLLSYHVSLTKKLSFCQYFSHIGTVQVGVYVYKTVRTINLFIDQFYNWTLVFILSFLTNQFKVIVSANNHWWINIILKCIHYKIKLQVFFCISGEIGAASDSSSNSSESSSSKSDSSDSDSDSDDEWRRLDEHVS